MAAWLIAAIERLPQRARRVIVAATALLLLAGAITSLTLQGGRGREAGRPAVTVRAPARRPAARPMPPRLRPPVSASNLRLAGRVARRFLVSYLKFAYGRASATSVEAVTLGLRSQLTRDRAQVTPAERRRHPRVVSLTTLGTTPGFVVANAILEDGGIEAFRLRLTLREQAGRWLVGSVQEG
jgi:hypothetical protein